jgi:hypothetical protein
MDKHVDMGAVPGALERVQRAGIRSELGITVGFPGERPVDVLETVKFVLRYRSAPGIVFPYVQPITVDGDSLLRTRPADFGLANTRLIDWESNDRRNVFPVRLYRWFFLSNAVFNASLSYETATGLDTVDRLDLNLMALASEIACLVYLLGIETGKSETAQEILDPRGYDVSWLPTEDPEYWHPDGVPRSLPLQDWWSADKNAPELKSRINRFLIHALRDLNEHLTSGEVECDQLGVRS